MLVKLIEVGDNILCCFYDIDIVIKIVFVDVSGDYNVNLDLVNERFFFFWIVILGVVFIKY